MPQMSPMPWIFIMLITILSTLIMSSSLYFNFKIKPSDPKNNNKSIFNIWPNGKF